MAFGHCGRTTFASFKRYPGNSLRTFSVSRIRLEQQSQGKKDQPKSNNNEWKIPEGFEHFFGKSTPQKNTGNNSNSSRPSTSNDKSSSKSEPSKNSSTGGSPKKNEDMTSLLSRNAAILGLLLALLVATNSFQPSRSISFQEFQSQLLRKGQVEKVVIVNHQTARVFLVKDSTLFSSNPMLSRQGKRSIF
jgi:AFG3 family protein